MRPTRFHEGWTCRHPDEPAAESVPVTIPHDAMLHEPREASSPGAEHTGWYRGGDYLYEKTFFVDPAAYRRRQILEFEGVYHNAEVLLNGVSLASHPNGYTGFTVDITGKTREEQENLLQVIVRNSDQPNSRWYTGSGIYRPVTLWTSKYEHILLHGVQIRTLGISPPCIEIRICTSMAGFASVRILDGRKEIAVLDHVHCRMDDAGYVQAVCRLDLPGAELWSPENPKVYMCETTFGDDVSAETFGIRSLAWGPEGLRLNDQRVLLLGACVHHDNGILGACCYPEAEERKVRLLKQAGFNAVRSAHNPCSAAFLSACDRLGMMVLDEFADQWYIPKTRHDYTRCFEACWREDLQAMVRKDYNHPSVVMYSIGNEVSETAEEKGVQWTRRLAETLRELDCSRPVTCGVNLFFNYLSSLGLGVYSERKAEKEEKKRRKEGTKPVGSQFFNRLAGLAGQEFMKRGAMLPGCDRKTRDAYSCLDIAGYNYGVYRYEKDLRRYPERLILGSETFCKDLWRFPELAEKHPRLIGDFVWSGMDYLGEVGLGAWEYKEYAPLPVGPGWVSSGCGRIDLTGNPLGEASYVRVALGMEQGPLMAVRPIRPRREKHSPSAWKMSNALPTWNWRGCDGQKALVEVYTRGAQAELRLNGTLLGRKTVPANHIVRFSVPWHPGILTAVALDKQGAETGTSELRSLGTETLLTVSPEKPTADPGEICFVRLRYTDEHGEVLPTERGILQVSAEGGELMGLGSACPYNTLGFTGARTDTYYGEALAAIRAGKNGRVRISVTDGTRSGNAEIVILKTSG